MARLVKDEGVSKWIGYRYSGAQNHLFSTLPGLGIKARYLV